MDNWKQLAILASTDGRRDACEAMESEGSQRKAAQKLGVAQSTLNQRLDGARKDASRKGWDPITGLFHPVADGQYLKGASTLYGPDGETKLQWVKSNADLERMVEMANEAVRELSKDVKPQKPVKYQGGTSEKDLMNFFPLTDCHIGGKSWHEETDDDWDLSIARETIEGAMSHLIDCSPKAETAFLCQLGDFLHYDSMKAITPSSGHIIDSDTRHQKMVRCSISVLRSAVNQLLSRYKNVVVLMARGNHDESGASWLQEAFSVFYEKEKRCKVIVEPSPFYSYEFGKVFLGMHHGHKVKPKGLIDVFSSRKYWKQLHNKRMAYIHSAHEHHEELIERNFGKVEMHPTLAAKSSYEAEHGYNADRVMRAITYAKDGYEEQRHCFYPGRR